MLHGVLLLFDLLPVRATLSHSAPFVPRMLHHHGINMAMHARQIDSEDEDHGRDGETRVGAGVEEEDSDEELLAGLDADPEVRQGCATQQGGVF